MENTKDWHSIICGWSEVRHYIARYPNARCEVQAHGNGAVRVLLPTREAMNEFTAC